ncbi:MAG: zinc ABC transporter substrate-binding protein [Lactobacillaceae bacterium]|jgi:iron/zinc/copper transport system substrate-binding protein|nr:zinc ABC transporter substrate-binding protein [Lactobacillaceae bacterium]
MKKTILITSTVILLLLIGFFAIFSTNKQQNKIFNNGKLNTVSSFSIINDIVQEIGGDKVNAYSITKIGADQHDYEPTPKDIEVAKEANIVFVNGLGLEKNGSGWFDKLMKSTNQQINIQNVSKGISTIKLSSNGVAGQDNPHAWNGVKEGIIYAQNITKILIKKDPKNKNYYQNRSDKYIQKLNILLNKWENKFNSLDADRKILVTQEAATSYLARDFGLKQYYIWEIDTESNGTPNQVKTLIDQLDKLKNIPAVFTEQGESDKPMKAVIKQIKTNIKGVLWTDSISNKKGAVPTYYDLLNYNLKTIYNGISS